MEQRPIQPIKEIAKPKSHGYPAIETARFALRKFGTKLSELVHKKENKAVENQEKSTDTVRIALFAHAHLERQRAIVENNSTEHDRYKIIEGEKGFVQLALSQTVSKKHPDGDKALITFLQQDYQQLMTYEEVLAIVNGSEQGKDIYTHHLKQELTSPDISPEQQKFFETKLDLLSRPIEDIQKELDALYSHTTHALSPFDKETKKRINLFLRTANAYTSAKTIAEIHPDALKEIDASQDLIVLPSLENIPAEYATIENISKEMDTQRERIYFLRQTIREIIQELPEEFQNDFGPNKQLDTEVIGQIRRDFPSKTGLTYGLINHLNEYQEQKHIMDAYEKYGTEIAKKQLHMFLSATIDSVNFNEVARDSSALMYLLELGQVEASLNNPQEFYRLNLSYDFVNSIIGNWGNRELLKKQPTSSSTSRVEKLAGATLLSSLAKTLEDKLAKLQPLVHPEQRGELRELLSIYKVGGNPLDTFYQLEQVQRQIADILESGKLKDSLLIQKPQFTQLLQTFIESLYKQATEAQFLQTEQGEIQPQAIDIIGVHDIAEGNEVIDKQELNKFLELFPPSFLKGLDSIVFLEAPHPEDQAAHPELEIGGLYKVYWENGTWKRQVQLFYPITAAAENAEGLKYAIEYTLAHEIGHHIHSEAITADELQQWESVRKEKLPQGVSPYHNYAEKREQEDPSRAGYGAREEFAETFALFMKQIHLLPLISQSRFDFMLALYARRFPDSEEKIARNHAFSKETLQELEEQGYTTQQLLDEHFSQPVELRKAIT